MSLSERLKRGLLTGALAATTALSFAAPAHAWWQGDYAYRTRINLDATAAGVATEVVRAPILVRLHQGNFSFADVKPDGSDLRFVGGDDRTPLKFSIERWDPQAQQALVWVDVTAIKSGARSAIYAYYGNKTAKPGQDPAGTFNGYRAVYHFDGSELHDATVNNVAAGGGAGTTPGLIGQGLKLDGTTPATIAAAAFPGGPLGVSLWVKPGAAAGHLLDVPGSAALVLEGGRLFLEANGKRSAGAPLPAGTWAHVALSNDGAKTLLYVNGQPAGEVAGALPAATGPAAIGTGFTGTVDELRVSAGALSQGATQLATASEGQTSKLLSFDTAEQTEGPGHNYFGILFAALTPDAWVVIGILGIMLAIAVWVMITKGLLVGRVGAANDDFLDAYQRQAKRSTGHDGLPAFDPGAGAASSTLGRLYQIGRRELADRLAEGRASDSRFAIRAQSIAAIRSALDAAQVRESQRINKQMVLLTIAISGGPFIGLLGTVLGVMITFASVAAAGEVNINAIAPGIAAALLATVAGLAVAIPALFGYNYLLSRVEEITAENQIFVDELEKRIAETWQDIAATPAMLAAE
ncbi:DUF2341 domain-containing protein [Sphingosinicellaceae bacterium]|nr:DUF2341 domain-containing protein [Sphingosinicellaceae bacterium]